MTFDRDWPVVVCAATGPSFSEEQAATIEAARAAGRCRVIAINDNYRRLPTADVLYAADRKWVKLHEPRIPRDFSGERWTAQERAAKEFPGWRWIRVAYNPGLSSEPDAINCGGNSGYQAIGLAYLFGARRIVLVGYDMQAGKTKGANHWFGQHEGGLSNNSPYETFVKRFPKLADDLQREGVDVINATINTALECFPRAALADALP